MIRGFLKKVLTIFFPTLLLSSFCGSALAVSDEDMQTLGMYYEPNDLVVSATRSPKPLSQSAENITVVTAKEIEMMGAHSLVDVLSNVPGIQINERGGLGSFDDFYVQGADTVHVLVMLDDVPLNFMSSQITDISGFPIQNIERIEIIKGPGSSSWGSALGGVINIVTKSPLDDKKAGGTISFSGGERGTRDTRGELSGTVGPFGYYLFAGNLTTHGFQPGTRLDQNDVYAKLRWDLPAQGSLQFTIAYDRGASADGDPNLIGVEGKLHRRYFLSTLSLNYPITDRIDLDLSLRTTYKRTIDTVNDLDGVFLYDTKSRETSDGGSGKLTWRGGINTVTAGFDYDHLDVDADPNLASGVKFISDKYGLFLNDTLAIGDFSITPGIRYDRMRPVGDFFSPSLGIAWNPTDKITLRTYFARGYSLPLLQPGSTQAKVITVQVGAETTYIPWLWLKTTFFWNQLSDVQNNDTETVENQKRQGVEVEAKTIPIFNTSLSAGYTYIEGINRETGEELIPFPRQIVKLGILYDNVPLSLRGSLLGRYVCGNSAWSTNAKSSAMLMDINLAKRVFKKNDTAAELFFSVHNILNGSQDTLANGFKNARRWFEGGIKFEF
jgi:vitamin B12 transporter